VKSTRTLAAELPAQGRKVSPGVPSRAGASSTASGRRSAALTQQGSPPAPAGWREASQLVVNVVILRVRLSGRPKRLTTEPG
jgi:hypothetical protein